jgi:hypothetical protein
MAMTKAQAKEQFKKLTSHLPANQQEALAAALEDETFGEGVAKWGMLESDYSRSKNELAEEKKQLAAKYADDYAKLKAWADDNGKTVEQVKGVWDEYNQMLQLYGKPNGNNPNPNPNQPASLTIEQAQKLWEEREGKLRQDFGTSLLDTAHVLSEHQRRFKEAAPVEEINEFIAKARQKDPSLTVRQAYEQYSAPRLEEIRNQEFEAKIKSAKEEAVKEYASKHKLPVDLGPRELSPAWDPARHELSKLNQQQQEEKGRDEWFKAWNDEAEKQALANR